MQNLFNNAMKHLILSAVAVLLFTLTVSAQPYAIDWYKVAGGGGTSTGGVYSVSGTAGQPDAGTMTGGSYGLVGGFWSLIAVVPTAGGPLLTIFRTPTNTVALQWPSPSTGYLLQQNTNRVNSLNWSNVVTVPTDNGTTKTVVVNPPAGNRYYRLFHP
jgi:hypothetical protein